jgi:hypothetical protein
MSVIWAFLLYWLVLFVACYLVTEYGQGFLYDEVTPYLWGKVAAASLILAIVLTIAHTSLDRMFSDGLGWTVGQAILWFLVFMFVLRFHPKHAAVLGVITFVLTAGMGTMAVDSLSETFQPTSREKAPVFDPKNKSLGLRKSAGATAPAPEEPKKAEEKK